MTAAVEAGSYEDSGLRNRAPRTRKRWRIDQDATRRREDIRCPAGLDVAGVVVDEPGDHGTTVTVGAGAKDVRILLSNNRRAR